MFPTVNVGPLAFPTKALIYLLGAWLALTVAERAARRLEVNADRVYGLATTALIAGFVGARLVFVAIYWSSYQDNLLTIVWPLNSGFNLWGGLLIGGAAAFFYGRYHQLRPWPMLDALAPALLVALIAVSLADFLAGPGFGTLTSLPWGITQFGVRRHPVQIYEILVGIVALVAWRQVLPYRSFPGQLFLLSAALYSGGRLFVDAYRENAWLTGDGFHVLQIISLVVMLAALYLLGRFSRAQATPAPQKR